MPTKEQKRFFFGGVIPFVCFIAIGIGLVSHYSVQRNLYTKTDAQPYNATLQKEYVNEDSDVIVRYSVLFNCTYDVDGMMWTSYGEKNFLSNQNSALRLIYYINNFAPNDTPLDIWYLDSNPSQIVTEEPVITVFLVVGISYVIISIISLIGSFIICKVDRRRRLKLLREEN